MPVLGKNHKIGIFILLWLLPISLTILNISRNYVTMSTITVGILSFILILINPKTSLLAIPFFTLLSPIAGFINIFSIHLLLSDFLFLLLGTQAIYLFLTKKIIINSRGLLILEVFIPFVFLFSTIFGIISQTLVTPRPILLLGQLIIVYYYTKNFAVDEEGWTAILNAWVAATILGSLLLLHSFIIGIDLSAFEQSYNRVLAGRSPDTQATFLIQPRYYYTTFHFALGISTIILIIKFIFSPHRKKIKIIIPLIILLIAIIVLQNKTTIFSIAGALTTFFIFYFFKSKIVRKKTLLLSLLFASITIVFLYYLDYYNSSYTQIYYWYNRLFHWSSLNERFVNYSYGLKAWFLHPFHLLYGMGPDCFDGSGNYGVTKQFKISGENLMVGTIDSGWISYLLEMGLIGFSLLLLLFYNSIKAVIKHINKVKFVNIEQSPSIYILVCLFYLIIAFSTQMLGYTKIVWLPFQILVIGLFYNRYNYNNLGILS